MPEKISIKKEIMNAKGKRMINKVKLDYSITIINKIQSNPELLEEIIVELEISKKDFIDYISGEKNANISFYDQALQTINRKRLYKENHSQK